MSTLVDSSVIIDLAMEDPNWVVWSRHAIVDRRLAGALLINPVIYAEVTAATKLDRRPALEMFDRVDLPWEAAELAGRAHAAYRRRGGPRLAILADFLIGAHAAVGAYTLLTRDPARVSIAFPGLEIITPGKPA